MTDTIKTEISQFNNVGEFGMGLFQHLIANLIQVSMMYQNVLNAMLKEGNMTEVFYEVGKTVKLLVTVPKVDLDDFNTGRRSVLDLSPGFFRHKNET